jgi:hypothetical protein
MARLLVAVSLAVLVAASVISATTLVVASASPGDVVKLTNADGSFVGSACVVDHREGRTYLLTAAHVMLAGAAQCEHGELRLERLSTDPDLALVSVPASFGRAFALGDGLQPREDVRMVGFTTFEGVPLETWGRVCNAREGWIDGAVHRGMSGGAVIGDDGRLDGIVVEFYDFTMAICVPAERIAWILEEEP